MIAFRDNIIVDHVSGIINRFSYKLVFFVIFNSYIIETKDNLFNLNNYFYFNRQTLMIEVVYMCSN